MLLVDGRYVPVRPRQTTSSGSTGGGTTLTFAQHMKAASGPSGNAGSNNANGTASWSNGDPNYQVVKRHDTLIGISNEDHVPLSQLYALNREFDPRRQDGILHYDRSPHGGWDPDFILPGDHIYLPYHPQPPQQPPHVPPVHKLPTPMPTTKPKPKNHAPTPFFKWGGGSETGFKGSKGLTLSEEPYFKGSFKLSPQWSINFKVKYTPKGKATLKPVDPNAKPDPAKPDPPKPLSKWGKFKAGIKPEKVSVDVGAVYNKDVEAGFSWEFKPFSFKPLTFKPFRFNFNPSAIKNAFAKSPLWHPSPYLSSKSPENILVDTAQVKAKVPIIKAPLDSYRGRNKMVPVDPKVPDGPKERAGFKPFKPTLEGTELQVAGEGGLHVLPGNGSALANFAAKSTAGDSPAFRPTPRWAGVTGFAVGTGASVAGATFTDTFAGRYVHNTALRQTVDGLGGVATGIVANHVTSSVVPQLGKVPFVAKYVVKPLTTVARPVVGLLKPIATSKAGQAIGNFLSKEGPTLAQDAKFAARFRFGARVAGPVGAAIAAAPDVISAINSFAHGKVGAGLTSLADGAIRAGTTIAGAAIGQALIPIPGVGAAIGSVVGGFVGDEIVGHQAQIVGAAKAVGHAAVSAGKAVGHAAVSAAKAVASFFGF